MRSGEIWWKEALPQGITHSLFLWSQWMTSSQTLFWGWPEELFSPLPKLIKIKEKDVWTETHTFLLQLTLFYVKPTWKWGHPGTVSHFSLIFRHQHFQEAALSSSTRSGGTLCINLCGRLLRMHCKQDGEEYHYSENPGNDRFISYIKILFVEYAIQRLICFVH